MAHAFDPGYGTEPFRTLCEQYPGADAYPSSQFRLEWGSILHRGRLDGSARLLVIGQDPAQHETIVRRVLVGEAGRRLQGFLAKVGIRTNYVIINTYLHCVYGSVRTQTGRGAALVYRRNQWLDALLAGGKVEGVVTLGTAAGASQMYGAPPSATARMTLTGRTRGGSGVESDAGYARSRRTATPGAGSGMGSAVSRGARYLADPLRLLRSGVAGGAVRAAGREACSQSPAACRARLGWCAGSGPALATSIARWALWRSVGPLRSA